MSKNPPNINTIRNYAQTYNPATAANAMKSHRNKSWFDDFKLLFSMMNDTTFKLQSSTKLSIGGALAYVVLPTDVVPDFVPLLGWVDDALVLKIVMDAAKGEIERYRKILK